MCVCVGQWWGWGTHFIRVLESVTIRPVFQTNNGSSNEKKEILRAGVGERRIKIRPLHMACFYTV